MTAVTTNTRPQRVFSSVQTCGLLVSERVRKPWKQLIDVHENSGSNREKKTFQGAVSGNRCKIIILYWSSPQYFLSSLSTPPSAVHRSNSEIFETYLFQPLRNILCPWDKGGMNKIVRCGFKNSSKLLFSRFQLIDSCHGDSSIKGWDFTEVIILSWHRCLSFIRQCVFRFSRFLSP